MRQSSKYNNQPNSIADNTFGTDFNAHKRQNTTMYPHPVTDKSCGTVVEAFIAPTNIQGPLDGGIPWSKLN